MKLKLGLLHTDLAFRFGLELCDVSRIYSKWVKALSRAMKFLIIWPDRQALRKNLPRCFKNYKNCVCIIDCSEIKIERSFNLNSRAQTWSNYKHSNTIKYLIGIIPAGAVSFLSHGWGGRVSKEITLKSMGTAYLLIVGLQLQWLHVELDWKYHILQKEKHKCQEKKLMDLEKYQMYAYMLRKSLVD